MSLKEKIDADIKDAMRNKRKEELTTLRSIKSSILLAETEKGASDEHISEETEMRLLTKAAKQRKESAEMFEKEGREDLAGKERFELEVINRYLPQPLTEEELDKELNTLVSEMGASGPQDMGKVMGEATKRFAGRAEGKIIAARVKNILNS